MNEHGWHLRKEISIGQIIATVTVAAGAILAYADLDKRVDLNAQALGQMAVESQRAEERTDKALAEINATLRRIEDRLNRVIDSAPPRP